MGAQPPPTPYILGGGQPPNPNECNSTQTRGETLTPNPNECYSTLTSETRDINLTRWNRYPVQKSFDMSHFFFKKMQI